MQAVRKTHRGWGRPLLAVSLASFLTLTASGCASQPETAPKKSEVIAEESSEESDVTPVDDACVDDGNIYGSVIVDKLEKGPDGEYCSIKIDPASPALKVDKQRVSDEVYAEGYTDADIAKAQAIAVDYVVSHVVDSPAVGQRANEGAVNNAAWLKEEGPQVLDDWALNAITETMALPYGVGKYSILSDGHVPSLVHDKNPRVKNLNVSVDSVAMIQNPNTGVRKMSVQVMTDLTYRVEPDAVDEWAALKLAELRDMGDTSPFGPFEFDSTQPTYMDFPISNKASFTKESLAENKTSGVGFDYPYEKVSIYN